jgi:CubicO group peptidase (beta-lactamase class C family)
VAALDLVAGWPGETAAVAVVRAEGTAAAVGPMRQAYGWASVTKLVTALATLVAVEDGTVALDEPAGPPGSTVRHLLAHASGLAFDDDRAIAAPGHRRIYSNTGYRLLGTLLAERSGIEVATYLREAVLDPIGAHDTVLDGSAAGGLVGPADDLARLAAELFAPRVVARSTLADAWTVAFPGLAGVLPGIGRYRTNDWGLGFEVRDAKRPHWTASRGSPKTVGHFGATGSFLWFDPDAAVACVCLTGHEFGPWALDVWPPLADAVLDEFAV